MEKMNPRKLILEDGTEYCGYGFGSLSDKKLELVFNTSMVGYQEILSDPSYTDQAVVMTYPIIGNYGINPQDFETRNPSIGALIVREYAPEPSNFRSSSTLGDFMKTWDIAGIQGIDTRELTRKIRTYGSCKVLLTGPETTAEQGKEILSQWEFAHDQVSRVSTKESWVSLPGTDCGEPVESSENAAGNSDSQQESLLHVAAIDCGMKLNIVRSLNALGCKVTVLPWNTKPETIQALKPDGVFLSNGPGDPTDVQETIALVKALHGKYPIFGICLGHQILSLSYGAETYKLKFGHRGGNHPVKNLLTDKVEITSQNHSYAVAEESLSGTGLEPTHINLLDQTIEGVQHRGDRAFSIQYHPESAPGPQDSAYLFSRFVEVMKGGSLDA
ncbi:MAG: glutamine-hydrolyzing carbamoyl-phosphate synthase small subunit [Lachnospiraceae bacterium]|nr:glutamine-hydrolyzing carbamoyl-phosphate synthase small subunit [Lachnospiraceae bacterium]